MSNRKKTGEFDELLVRYMRRIRSSARSVAETIGVSRQTVLNWKYGITLPKEREPIIKCATFLRLEESEKDAFIRAAGFSSDSLSESEPVEDLSYLLFKGHIESAIRKLSSLQYPVMVQFIQADLYELSLHNALLNQIKRSYKPENVLQLYIPPHLNNADQVKNKINYFKDIAQQCKFVDEYSKNPDFDDTDFERALRERIRSLHETEEIFLLISNFEKGSFELNRSLATIIRSLSDRFERRFHVMICGGEKLEEIALGNGVLSLLNHATKEYWQEFDESTVGTLAKYRFKLKLTDTLAKNILKMSGGHFQLLNECLALLEKYPSRDVSSFSSELSDAACIWQAFLPLRIPEKIRQQICLWLEKEEITKAQPFILDDTLRRLYWKNLITNRVTSGGDKLCWRCSLIQTIGQTVMKCHSERM